MLAPAHPQLEAIRTAINVTGGLDELASVIGSASSLFAILHEGKVAGTRPAA